MVQIRGRKMNFLSTERKKLIDMMTEENDTALAIFSCHESFGSRASKVCLL